jgi:transposase-like protein
MTWREAREGEREQWYVACPLRYRHSEELRQERGASVDHSTVNRRKGPVWISRRMAETYITIKGQWRYRYRAGDKTGQTVATLVDVSGLVVSFTGAGLVLHGALL